MTIPPSQQEGRLRAFGLLLIAALLASVTVAVALWAKPTQARPLPVTTTFTVNSTADLEDEALSDSPNACDTGRFVLGSGPECTLRAAIQEANNTSGASRIHFDIPRPGVKTISPASGLPTIREPVTIDGYSQSGASPNTLAQGTDAVLLIELDGTNAGNANGLFLAGAATGNGSSGSVVKGLVINRFQRDGISITSDANKIQGNFVGTDPSGTQDLGNGFHGVGNGAGSSNIVGGTTPDARNLISGNGFSGVGLGCCGGQVVQGNLIGTKKDGASALGNTGSGVGTSDGDHTIGGAVAGAANTIAFNGEDGIGIGGGDENDDNRVLRNSIFSNGDLGIDLGDTAPTANDGGAANDADTGPNGLQNKPVLRSAVTSSDTTTIRGVLDTRPNTTFTVQFFSQGAGNEGKTFVGSRQVDADQDPDGDGSYTFIFRPTNAVASGQKITATATGPEGTSEFSAPRAVTAF